MSERPAPSTIAPLPIPEWKKQLPMWLTSSRMLVCPIFVVLLTLEKPLYGGILAAILFMLASITDWFDGYFARKYNAISSMGQFMDPIADKILVASVLIMLIPAGKVGPILVLVLLARDILIGGIRSVAAADRVIIDAKATGKWKTGLQMVSIPAILISPEVFGTDLVYRVGLAGLWISVILSLISGYQYVAVYRDSRRSQLGTRKTSA